MGIGERRTTVAHGRTLGAALAAAGLLAALAAVPASAADEDVAISGFSYSPGTVTITVGDSVTWTNSDAQAHTASADDGSFDTSSIGNGDSATIEFSTAGSYPYHCEFHPDMAGTVVVESASGEPPATDTAAPLRNSDRAPAPGGMAPIALGLVFGLAIVLGLRRFRGA
jgi:plastocyanin